MKVGVIPGKCSGHGRCAVVAPDVYELNDDGYLEMPLTPVPSEFEGLARRGVRACPERAIALEDDVAAGAPPP